MDTAHGLILTCGTIVAGYKMPKARECERCHVVIVRKIKGRRHDTMDLYATKEYLQKFDRLLKIKRYYDEMTGMKQAM